MWLALEMAFVAISMMKGETRVVKLRLQRHVRPGSVSIGLDEGVKFYLNGDAASCGRRSTASMRARALGRLQQLLAPMK